jgi:hypothetical protein
MTKQDTQETVADLTSKLIGLWESGDMPERVAHTMLNRQRSGRPSDTWSFGNQILMWLAGTEDARTYNAWQAVERQVRKREDGGQAFYIYKPIKRTITVEDKVTGEKSKRSILVGFGLQPEFRVEDTDGKPVEYPDYAPAELPPLLEVAEAWGIRVVWEPADRGAYGGYSSHTRSIRLHDKDAVTFLHELVHVAHEKVLEEAGKKLVGGQDPTQEIVAETSAAALCLLYGVTGFEAESRSYVAHYAKSTPEEAAKAVVKTFADIERVLMLILETAAELARIDDEAMAEANVPAVA